MNRLLEYYAAKKFGQNDFMIKRIKNGDMTPINWWEESEKETLTNKEEKIIKVARNDYGIRHGITIPIYSTHSGIAGISVTSADKGDEFCLLCTEKLELIRAIAQIFNDRVLASSRTRRHFLAPFLQALSDMEKDVLKKLSQGYAPKVIAHQLNSSPKYINSVIHSLRKKFGGITRNRLLYTAGLIAFDELVDES